MRRSDAAVLIVVDWNLVNIITEFFVGGGESTSDTLNWFMLMMCCYPHIQRKVQCEIDTVIGPHQIIYEDMKRLAFLLGFLKLPIEVLNSTSIE